MIMRALLASGVTLALSLPLAAQEPPPPPPPHADVSQADGPKAAPPPPLPGPSKAPRHGGAPRQGPPGPHGMDRAGGPPPPPPPKGFELDYGRGVSLKVNCGDEAMAACLEAVRPVIDKMPVFNPAMFPGDRP